MNFVLFVFFFAFIIFFLLDCAVYFTFKLIENNKLKNTEIASIDAKNILRAYKQVISYLDIIVTDAMSDYIAMTPDLDQDYITEEAETEIREKVKELTLMRISPLAFHKIEMVLNDPDKILATKIYLAVTSYVIENNQEQ
jgi:hypothetical protein